MKMLKLTAFLVLLFTQCIQVHENNDAPCLKSKQKSSELIEAFYNDNDTSHLDSALICIDNVLGKCDKLNNLLSLRKLSIFSLKRDYSQALLFIDTFNNDIFNDLPYFKKFLFARFKAMQSQAKGDTISRNVYLKSIVKDIDDFLVLNKEKADSLCKLSKIEIILKNPISTAELQYYYYRSILNGGNNLEAELVINEKEKGYNKDFCEMIRATFDEDFMIFTGF